MRKRDHDELIEFYRQRIVAAEERVRVLERQLAAKDAFWLDRVRELEDSTRALSLDQLRGMHPTVAMEARVPEPVRKLFRQDPTGMFVEEVDPRDLEVGS